MGSWPDFLIFFVDCLLLFSLWVVSTCILICLVLLLDGFSSLIFIIYRVFLLLCVCVCANTLGVITFIAYHVERGIWLDCRCKANECFQFYRASSGKSSKEGFAF
jgi:hypothetical protein